MKDRLLFDTTYEEEAILDVQTSVPIWKMIGDRFPNTGIARTANRIPTTQKETKEAVTQLTVTGRTAKLKNASKRRRSGTVSRGLRKVHRAGSHVSGTNAESKLLDWTENDMSLNKQRNRPRPAMQKVGV